MQLIYVVRDPIVRLRSHYQHRVMTGAETAPPEVALLENPTYVTTSKYAMQLERYLDHFPREQVLIVRSESLRTERQATVREVYDFLGVDSSRIPAAIETEFYRTAARRSYPPVVWWARRMAKRHAPQAKRAKELVDSLLSRAGRTVPAEPDGGGSGRGDDVLSPQLKAKLADLLRDDVARLRAYMPPRLRRLGSGLTAPRPSGRGGGSGLSPPRRCAGRHRRPHGLADHRPVGGRDRLRRPAGQVRDGLGERCAASASQWATASTTASSRPGSIAEPAAPSARSSRTPSTS